MLGVGPEKDWLWDQRTLIHLTLLPTSKSWAHSTVRVLGMETWQAFSYPQACCSGESEWRVLRGWRIGLRDNQSFLPWEWMRDLDTVKCVTSLFKQLVWGYRVAAIYTKRHNTCFPQVEFPFKALTSEPQHVREPAIGSPQGTSPWHIHPGSLFHTHRTSFVRITATSCRPYSSWTSQFFSPFSLQLSSI